MGTIATEQRATQQRQSIRPPMATSSNDLEDVVCVDCGHDHPVALLRDDSPEAVCLKCMQRRLLAQFVPADL